MFAKRAPNSAARRHSKANRFHDGKAADTMLTPDIATLLQEPAMMIMSTETDSQWPTIGRCVGARVTGPQLFEVIFSGNRFPEIRRHITNGCRIAVTLVRLRNYVTFQIKGSALAEPLDSADAALVETYRQRISDFFQASGVHQEAIEHWIGGTALLRARIIVSEVYDQTPGPRAGTAVGLSPA